MDSTEMVLLSDVLPFLHPLIAPLTYADATCLPRHVGGINLVILQGV